MNGLKYVTVLLFCLMHTRVVFSQEIVSPPSADYSYYLQLQNDEFYKMMIPRERFLLDLVETVNYEITKRKSEGTSLSDLGVYDIVSPEEKRLDALVDEMKRIRNLLGEIEKLERLAKQQVNFEILELLSGLKARIREVFQEGYDNPHAESTPDTVLISSSQEEEDSFLDLDEDARRQMIFDKWKYNWFLNYKYNMNKYLYLRIKLLQTATDVQEKRMFQYYYRRALENYTAGDFMLARLELRDILQNYSHLEVLDDVLYYASEAAYGLNLFDEATAGYEQLLRNFPNSSFRNQTITKLIYIHYIYGDYHKLADYYSLLLTQGITVKDENLTTVSYLIGYAFFKMGQYSEALNTLGRVIPGTRYYYPALYLSGTCYSNLKQIDSAIKLYQRIIREIGRRQSDQLLSHIINNSYLKLGLL
ncbi:MAG TPA: tetratricopeptide repeat protein, partial [bacterium]|nr:tetratricopeptide repeat protein [bacterium]